MPWGSGKWLHIDVFGYSNIVVYTHILYVWSHCENCVGDFYSWSDRKKTHTTWACISLWHFFVFVIDIEKKTFPFAPNINKGGKREKSIEYI